MDVLTGQHINVSVFVSVAFETSSQVVGLLIYVHHLLPTNTHTTVYTHINSFSSLQPIIPGIPPCPGLPLGLLSTPSAHCPQQMASCPPLCLQQFKIETEKCLR